MAIAPAGLTHGPPRSTASASIVTIALSLLAVGVFTLLAGSTPEAGTIMILVMVTLWTIFAITESKVIAGLGNVVSSLVGNPTNKTN